MKLRGSFMSPRKNENQNLSQNQNQSQSQSQSKNQESQVQMLSGVLEEAKRRFVQATALFEQYHHHKSSRPLHLAHERANTSFQRGLAYFFLAQTESHLLDHQTRPQLVSSLLMPDHGEYERKLAILECFQRAHQLWMECVNELSRQESNLETPLFAKLQFYLMQVHVLIDELAQYLVMFARYGGGQN
eukprot:TRINITY_DN20462_c0_g1_i1.p1 TRINITY_DN20462_c0_g1~~TRINITY_DN20462_c0_g1_i1.p1  ORF type:complete len:216 (-),score=38.62 TRINITY_DN20462_c0_g1_i1:23-586(-)